MLNPADLLKTAIIAFAAVWIINHALDKMGMSQYKA